MNILAERSRVQVSARLSDAAVGRGHAGKCRPAALDVGVLHPQTDLFQFRPYSGPLPLAPKPVERIAEWKARPLRAGASVGSSMRSFANGICAKLTTVANFKARPYRQFSRRARSTHFRYQPEIHLDIRRISTTSRSGEQGPSKARPCARSEQFVLI